mgnify:CR=1 FL=1
MEHEVIQLEREIADIKSTQAALEQQAKTLFNRIGQMEELVKSVQTLALSVRDLTNAQANTSSAVKTLRKDVDEIKSEPSKRWKAVTDKALMLVVGALIGYILKMLGLG